MGFDYLKCIALVPFGGKPGTTGTMLDYFTAAAIIAVT